jgi:sec-independent protein translocase protein TatA
MKLGTTEILAILAVVVIIFGPTQIPKLTKMFGKSIKNFRDGMNADEDEKDTKVSKNAEEKED